MTTFVRGACASLSFGLAMFLAGCGGGGSGLPTPTSTPNNAGPITSGQLVFVSTRTGASEIFRSGADGTKPVQLTHLAGTSFTNVEKPSVSPDGTRIVFQYGNPATGSGTNNLEIGIVNTDGTNPRSLTNDTVPAGRPDDYAPVFSPDSRYIYWTSTRSTGTTDKVPHIWRMNGLPGAEGKDQANGLFITEPSAYPSLSSKGNTLTLAYAAVAQANSPIALQPLSGGAISGTVQRIGGNIAGGSVFDVALSPDGTRVAFSTASGAATTGTTSATSSTAATLNILSTSTGATIGSALSGGPSNGGAAWSRDSNTLYFDAAGTTANRQIFSSSSPFSAKTQVTTDAQGANFSPAFLPGS